MYNNPKVWILFFSINIFWLGFYQGYCKEFDILACAVYSHQRSVCLYTWNGSSKKLLLKLLQAIKRESKLVTTDEVYATFRATV